MQDITGFTVGNNYELSFYQTVVKQTNSIDQSGSWRVYLDGVLIGTTAVSTSLLSPNDINLVWDNRIINFTATSTTHTLKFIPWDDDPNIQASETDITGGLRMGIDNIEIIVTSPTPPIVNLGTDQTLCVGDSLLLDATYPNSTYLWQDGSTDSVLSVYQSGLYWVEVTNIYGTTTDSITVSEMISPMIQLGPDTIMCISETFILSSANVDVDYLWQDGTTNSWIEVTSAGTYWLEVTNSCGSSSDSITINFQDCPDLIEMPNVFAPNNDQVNDFFLPIKVLGITISHLTVINRWGEIVFETTDPIDHWNGSHRGYECTSGVYFWILEYSKSDNSTHTIHGNVHLIR